MSLPAAAAHIGERTGAFVVDGDGRPTSLLTLSDALRAAGMGTTDLTAALRQDFDQTDSHTCLNEVYAAAGRGLPIAVVNESGVLVGNLDPRLIMEEMGRVEQLIDGFERETFL